jgi:hypothetical protein
MTTIDTHTDALDSISKLKKAGFTGPDASLDVSLFEYGIAYKVTDDEILFIYGTQYGYDEYIRFDRCPINTDINIAKVYYWADLKAVQSSNGYSTKDWNTLPLEQKITDLLRYYGYDNLFGSSYWEGFTITPNK